MYARIRCEETFYDLQRCAREPAVFFGLRCQHGHVAAGSYCADCATLAEIAGWVERNSCIFCARLGLAQLPPQRFTVEWSVPWHDDLPALRSWYGPPDD